MDEFVKLAWAHRESRGSWADFWDKHGNSIREAFPDNWKFDCASRRLLGIVQHGEDVNDQGVDPLRDRW